MQRDPRPGLRTGAYTFGLAAISGAQSIEAHKRLQRPLLGGKRKHPECTASRKKKQQQSGGHAVTAVRHEEAKRWPTKPPRGGRHQWQQEEMGREPTLASAEAKNSSSMTSLPSPRPPLLLSRPFPAPLLPFSRCACVGNAVSLISFSPSFFPGPDPQTSLFTSVLCFS